MNRSASLPIRTNPIWRGKALAGSVDLEILLASLPIPAFLVDKAKETILIANPILQKILGASSADLLGLPVQTFLEGWQTSWSTSSEPVLSTLKSRSNEYLQMRIQISVIDSNAQWLLVSMVEEVEVSPLLNKEHQGALEHFIDLSKLIQTGNVNEYISILMDILVGIMKMDVACLYRAEGDYPHLSCIAQSGTQPAFPDIIPSTDLMRLAQMTVWQPGKPVHTELHRSGRIANLSIVASAPIGENGALSGLLVVGKTKRKFSETDLGTLQFFCSVIGSLLQNYILVQNLVSVVQQNEKQLLVRNQLFDTAQEGVIILRPDLTIIEINSTAEMMLGYAAAEVQQQPVENVLIGPVSIVSALEAAQKGNPVNGMGTVYLHRRNGQSFPANCQVVPVMLGNDVSALLVLIIDVSENEQNRIRTQQLEQRAFLGDFTAVFAHEVRNPINNISTGLQLLASLIDPNDPNQDVVGRMLGDCTRLNQLMESILSFSRPVDIKLERIDLTVFLRRILDRWRPRFARVNVNHYFQTAEGLPVIMGDQRSLDQVFTNLISNAVEAMSKNGGTLALKIGLGPSIGNRAQVEVTVSDNGPGIPDEVKERIFEPFVTTNPRGNGLGLAITKRIVTAHHGSIGVNTFPGGTVFHVCLPAASGEDE